MLTQSSAGNIFRNDEIDIVVQANFVDCQNVWMIERGGSARFTSKTQNLFPVFGLRQNFERNFPLQSGVLRQIDFSRPPGAEECFDQVLAHHTSWRQRSFS